MPCPEVSTNAHLPWLHDAARLSQARPLPKKNRTEENSLDLQIPPLTLHMRKQGEQEGAYASSSDKSVTGRPGTVRASPTQLLWDIMSYPAASSQLGTRSARGIGEAAMSTRPADACIQQGSIPRVKVPELPEGKDAF